MCGTPRLAQALGMLSGSIHILDVNGNRIREYPSHTAMVNELSIDATGDYIASCSDDGTCGALVATGARWRR